MKNRQPLISIIVPIYNVEKYLQRCIDSILNQTYQNLEIILIDDGSTDASGKIADKYAKKTNTIVVIHKKNAGVSAARNTGIEKSNGEYICFVDSDDTIEPSMIEVLYRNMIRYNVDLSICNYKRIRKKTICNNYKSMFIKTKQDYHKNKSIYLGFLCNKMFKASIAKKIKLDEKIFFCEDELYVTKYVELCNNFYYDERPLYNYFIYKHSNSNRREWNSRKVTILIAKEKEMEILRKYGFETYKNYYQDYLILATDIKHQFNKKIVTNKKLSDMFKTIIHSNISLKEKFTVLLKHKLYWIYYLTRIVVRKKRGYAV